MRQKGASHDQPVVRGGVRLTARCLLTLASTCVLVPAGRADDAVLLPVATRASFWEAARDPARARIDALLRQGRARLMPALGAGMLFGAEASIHRRTGIENALARFERALSIDPAHPEALYLAGKALALWERRSPEGKIERRTREAIERFETLRNLAPLYRAEDVSFELGVLLTREEDFRGAAEAYERALSLRLDAGSPSTLLSNLAEVSMQSEDLERALSLYQRAVLEGSRDERVLATWGMAVALDRLGERGEAIERAKQAIRDDQRPMAVLRQGRVFFVPSYEALYYDGLGHLAQALLELGSERELEHTLRDAVHVLSKPAAAAMLPQLQHQLSGLREEGHGELLSAFTLWVERRKGELSRVKPKKTLGSDEKRAPQSAEVKAIMLGLRSLRAFLRYLDRGGAHGPWALDAQAHVNQLLGWFAAPRPKG